MSKRKMSRSRYALVDLDNTLIDSEKVVNSARKIAQKLHPPNGAYLFDQCYTQARGWLDDGIKAATPYFISPLYIAKLFSRYLDKPELKRSVFKELFFEMSFADCLLKGAKELLKECQNLGFITKIITGGIPVYQRHKAKSAGLLSILKWRTDLLICKDDKIAYLQQLIKKGNIPGSNNLLIDDNFLFLKEAHNTFGRVFLYVWLKYGRHAADPVGDNTEWISLTSDSPLSLSLQLNAYLKGIMLNSLIKVSPGKI